MYILEVLRPTVDQILADNDALDSFIINLICPTAGHWDAPLVV